MSDQPSDSPSDLSTSTAEPVTAGPTDPPVTAPDPIEQVMTDLTALRGLHKASDAAIAVQASAQADLDAAKASMAITIAAEQAKVDAANAVLTAAITAAAVAHAAIGKGVDLLEAEIEALRA